MWNPSGQQAASEAHDAEEDFGGIAAEGDLDSEAAPEREGSLAEIFRAYGDGETREDAAGPGGTGHEPGWMMHGFGPGPTGAGPQAAGPNAAGPKAAGPEVEGEEAMDAGSTPTKANVVPTADLIDEMTSAKKDPAKAKKETLDKLQSTGTGKNKAQAGRFAHVAGVGYRTIYKTKKWNAMVFLPDQGINEENVQVFLFFHGYGGEFTDNVNGAEGHIRMENAAAQANLAQAITSSGRNIIGIMPMRSAAVVGWGAEGFKGLVDGVVTNVGTLLGIDALKASSISVAGHSAGGMGVGHAAAEDKERVTDVTIQDGTYGFDASFEQLREWFLLGKGGPKTLRVIARAGERGERKALRKGQTLHEETLKKTIADLKRPDLTVTTVFDGTKEKDTATRTHGMKLEKKIEVTGKDGLQGTMMILGMPTEDHFKVRDATMADVIAAGDSSDDTLIGKT